MPMQRELYPEDWETISQRVRERAGWQCEQCGVKHRAIILRRVEDPTVWRYGDAFTRPRPGERMVRVVITTHHIGVDKPDGAPGDPDDKQDCRDENLVALCQFCHLQADRAHHLVKAKHTRQRKRQEQREGAGQRSLFEVMEDGDG